MSPCEEVNAAAKAAADGRMKRVLAYDPEQKVSIDFNHTEESCIFAPDQTIVVGGPHRAGAGLVRQRMGVLGPHGRCGGGDGQTGLSLADVPALPYRGRQLGEPP